MSYKPGVGDMRESPALKIIAVLRRLGADVVYHDPHVPELPELRLRSVSSRRRDRRTRTSPLIVTAHPGVDHDAIVDRSPLSVDLRGVTRYRADKPAAVTL